MASTSPALKAHLDARRRLVVYSGGAANTIYGDPAVNHAFRAWHDYTHWRLGEGFTVEGEIAVCEAQCRELLDKRGNSEAVRRMCHILRAEIIGQRLFYARHRRYVGDQRSFIEAYLRDPGLALSNASW